MNFYNYGYFCLNTLNFLRKPQRVLYNTIMKSCLCVAGCPEVAVLKLLNNSLISVQLLIKELLIKKKSCISDTS